jgi:hypothetical protein
MMNSESAAVHEGGDACAKKTAGLLRWRVCAVFFGMCAGKHRKGSDSESSSRFPEIRKAGSRTAGLCFFLWHQRKKKADWPAQNETPSCPGLSRPEKTLQILG